MEERKKKKQQSRNVVNNYMQPLHHSLVLPFLCPSCAGCDSWLCEWRLEAKLASFRRRTRQCWSQIMCAVKSEESVIKAKPLVIMSAPWLSATSSAS